MNNLLDGVEQVVGSSQPRNSVIWLHGLGADGHDFVPIVPQLRVDEVGIRFVFPHAPTIPVTINGGYRMPAWYDIRDADLATRHDETGIRNSHEQVTALIARENERGVACQNIVLAGFSQGGAIALHTGLRHPSKIAGIVALSTYLVLEETLSDEASPANADTPVFAAHGTRDPMVIPPRGEAARDTLQRMGHDVEWHTYPMEHAVCAEEIDAVGTFLRRVLPAAS